MQSPQPQQQQQQAPQPNNNNNNNMDDSTDMKHTELDEEELRLRDLFNQFQIDNIVSVQDVTMILAGVGLNDDPDTWMHLVADQPEAVSWEQVRMIANYLWNRKGDDGNVQDIVIEDVVSTVEISLWSFIVRRLTCEPDPPATVFSIRKPSIEIKPTHQIVVSIALTLLLCLLAIGITLSLLWVYAATDAVYVDVETAGRWTSGFMQSSEKSFMHVVGTILTESSALMMSTNDAMIEHDYARVTDKMLWRANAATAAFDSTVMFHKIGMSAAMTTVASILSQVPDTTILQRTLNNLHTTPTSTLMLGSTDASSAITIPMTSLLFNATVNGTVTGSSQSCTQGCLRVDCLHTASVQLLGRTFDASGALSFGVGFPLSSSSSGGAAVSGGGEMSACLLISYDAWTLQSMRISASLRQTFTNAIQRSLSSSSASADWTVSILPVDPTGVVTANTMSSTTYDCTAASSCIPWNTFVARSLYVMRPLFGLVQPPTSATSPASSISINGTAAPMLYAVSAPTQSSNAITISADNGNILNKIRDEHIDVFIYVNTQLVEAPEKNVFKSMQQVWHQVTPFSKPTECIGTCDRSVDGFGAAVAATNNRNNASVIVPDYRPVPVISGAVWSPTLVVTTEEEIHHFREWIFQGMLLSAVRRTNAYHPDGITENTFYGVVGQLRTRTFDPTTPCDTTYTTCGIREGFGVVYRTDCIDCLQAPYMDPSVQGIEPLNPLLHNCTASASVNCSAEYMRYDQTSLAYAAVNASGSGGRTIQGKDYHGDDVIAYVEFLTNFSTGLVCKVDSWTEFWPIYRGIAISAGIVVGVTIFCVLGLVVFAGGVLKRFEHDWSRYKGLIVTEREAFAENGRDIMPPAFAERLGRREPISFAQYENLTIGFAEMTKFTTREDNFSSEDLSRYLTYTYHVMECLLKRWNVYRIRIAGDVSTYVAGLPDASGILGGSGSGSNGSNQAAAAANHEAVNMEDRRSTATQNLLSFFVNVVQVFGPRYAHFPHHCKLIQKTFGSTPFTFSDVTAEATDVGNIVMPNFKIGVHCGPVTFGASHLPVGIPAFDVLGPPMGICHRLMTTCLENCIQISQAAFGRLPPSSNHFFTAGRKTKVLVANSSVPTVMLGSANVHIYRPLLVELGIKYARLTTVFTQLKDGNSTKSSSKGSSLHSGSIASSTSSFANIRPTR